MDDGERHVLDACAVIDFCGRTDNLSYLLDHIGDSGVITSAVEVELRRQKERNYSGLSQFLDLIESGTIEVLDPDLENETAARILRKWSAVFGQGEVSSAALAASKGWIFVSRDHAPMRQLRLSETIRMETTEEVLTSLERRRAIAKGRAADIRKATKACSKRRRQK